MSLPSLHVLYEYGADARPHGSAFIRLLRPLSHPAFLQRYQVHFDQRYEGQPAAALVLDRLWRPADVRLEAVARVVESARQAGARFIYTLDDDFLNLPPDHPNPLTAEQRAVVEYALRQADGLLVTTPALEERLQAFNPAIQVAPHALDERLLVPRRPAPARRRKVIGYMGTRTHDDDLLMIAPALQAVCRRHPEVELQLIGVADRPAARQALSGLPARWIEVPADETEYPLFLMWFSGQVGWHIGLAPLVDSPFNQVKSDIKLLDYAAIAAAGVFSRGPAYAGSVRHLENGWLAENTPPAWEEALERLLADEPLRLELARAANLELYTRRTLAQAAPRWAQAFDALLPGGD